MKKILYLFTILFSLFAVVKSNAQCPAGQCQITVLVEGDAFMLSDPTTFSILVNGAIVASEVPVSNEAGYTYDLGCLNSGDLVQFQYIDGFGDGIIGPGFVYPNMINYFKDGYQVLGEDVSADGTEGPTGGYVVATNDPPNQGCAAPPATNGGPSADPAGVSISAAGDGSDCFDDLTAIPPPIGGIITPADATSVDITQCFIYTPSAGINNFFPLGGAAGTGEYNSEAAMGNDCGAFTETNFTVTNVTGGACTLLTANADGSYAVRDTDTYEICYTGNLAGSTTQDGDDICLISTLVYCGVESTVICPEFNAVSYGPFCNGYDICFGYNDADQDGVGDGGEDPTGTTMTVADGLANSVAQAPINDGLFFFDSDNDDVADAIGYCLTVLFDNPTCTPEPYTPLVTLVCPDGTPATFNAVEVTDYDILANLFGIAGGTAIYPALATEIIPVVCPAADGTGGEAPFVEVTSTDGSVCTTVTGEVPAACDATNTTDTAVPVQTNPISDPLLSAAVGAGSFVCGLDATADLTYVCDNCTAIPCEITVTISNFACDTGADPDDPADDTVTFDYTVTDVGGTGTTWSSDQGDAGVAYGSTISVGPLPADGTTFTINVNDDGDTACTDSASQTLTSCSGATTDVPTLSQWGLITLMLALMSFGAIKMSSITTLIAIRRKDEE